MNVHRASDCATTDIVISRFTFTGGGRVVTLSNYGMAITDAFFDTWIPTSSVMQVKNSKVCKP